MNQHIDAKALCVNTGYTFHKLIIQVTDANDVFAKDDCIEIG